MYISEKSLKKLNILSKFQIVFGGANIAFWSMACILNIVDGDEVLKSVLMGIILLIAFGAVFICGIKNARVKGNAYRYNSIFLADMDGYLSMQELTGKIGINEENVKRQLESLLRKGYLTNCTMQYGDVTYVVLNCENKRNFSANMESITCPKCGANILAKKGFFSKCKHCGVEIKL